jgi:hypothetical protein
MSRLAATLDEKSRTRLWRDVLARINPDHRTLGAELASLAGTLSAAMTPTDTRKAGREVLAAIGRSNHPDVVLALATVLQDLHKQTPIPEIQHTARAAILKKIVNTRPHSHPLVAWERANHATMLAQAAGRLPHPGAGPYIARAWAHVLSNARESVPRAESGWAMALAALAPLVERRHSTKAWHALVDLMLRPRQSSRFVLQALGNAAGALSVKMTASERMDAWKRIASEMTAPPRAWCRGGALEIDTRPGWPSREIGRDADTRAPDPEPRAAGRERGLDRAQRGPR